MGELLLWKGERKRIGAETAAAKRRRARMLDFILSYLIALN